jgi:Eukaryotic glutathione synthase, ATP binding domain
VRLAKIVSEIGFYSWTLSDNENIIDKGYGDNVARSKMLGLDEGGICSGNGFIDSYTII